MTTRIDRRFAALKEEGRAALVTFVMAGDPDYEPSLAILKALPAAGADVIELGMPFTDPMADGPAIQAAGLRALASGQNMKRTLALVREFRRGDDTTPIVLMGYYNPIYVYGVEKFLADARSAGVDGLIIVDLPPEEDTELCLPALKAGFNFIRLATPTTDDKRLPTVLANTSGFVYYVSITGITGAAAPDPGKVTQAVARIKRHTKLPVCVGFGVRTAEQARAIAEGADGVVVGSALVEAVRGSLTAEGKPTPATASSAAALVRALADGVRSARRVTAGAPASRIAAGQSTGVEFDPAPPHIFNQAGGNALWPAIWFAIGCGRKRARCSRGPTGCIVSCSGRRAPNRVKRSGSRRSIFWRPNSRFWRSWPSRVSMRKRWKPSSRTANWLLPGRASIRPPCARRPFIGWNCRKAAFTGGCGCRRAATVRCAPRSCRWLSGDHLAESGGEPWLKLRCAELKLSARKN